MKDCTINAMAIMASAVIVKVRNELDQMLRNRDLRPVNVAGILSSVRLSMGETLITVDFIASLLLWLLLFDSDVVAGSPGFQLDLRLLAVSGTSTLERVSKDLRVCAMAFSLEEDASAMFELVSGVLSLAKLALSAGWPLRES